MKNVILLMLLTASLVALETSNTYFCYTDFTGGSVVLSVTDDPKVIFVGDDAVEFVWNKVTKRFAVYEKELEVIAFSVHKDGHHVKFYFDGGRTLILNCKTVRRNNGR